MKALYPAVLFGLLIGSRMAAQSPTPSCPSEAYFEYQVNRDHVAHALADTAQHLKLTGMTDRRAPNLVQFIVDTTGRAEAGQLEDGEAKSTLENIAQMYESMAKLEKMGVKFVKNVDKSEFLKIAEPIQDKTASALGPHAVELLKLVREVK